MANLPAKTQTNQLQRKQGRPRKEVKFLLAKEFLSGTTPLDSDELAELSRIFPEADRKVACYIYSLRTRKKCTKPKICRILTMDHRTFEKFYGTITLSGFLSLKIEEWISRADESVQTMMPDIPDGLDFKERTDIKREHAMENILDTIMFDPTKIFDADLEQLTGAYEKIHKIHRLENGQSTDNKSVVTRADPEAIEKNKQAQEEIQAMALRLNRVMANQEKMEKQLNEQIVKPEPAESIRTASANREKLQQG